MQKLAFERPIVKICSYLVLTLLLSLPFYFLIINSGSISKNPLFPLGLMWCPGISGLICSMLFGHKFQDIGLRKGPFKFYVVAYVVPIFIALFIFLGLVIFQLGEFEISPILIQKKGSIENVLLSAFLIGPIVGTFFGFCSALGEEIGWRGFLYTQMHELKVKYADYVIGLIWSLWHWPIILFGDYATSKIPVLSALMFSVSLVASGAFYGWLRRNSGSVFPIALTHASHNLFIQAIYPVFIKKGPLDEFFGGESGVLCMIAYLFLAFIFHRRSSEASN